MGPPRTPVVPRSGKKVRIETSEPICTRSKKSLKDVPMEDFDDALKSVDPDLNFLSEMDDVLGDLTDFNDQDDCLWASLVQSVQSDARNDPYWPAEQG